MPCMNKPIEYFDIRFTKRVEFRDQNRTLVKAYDVGDTCRASGCTETYFITPMGGIYFDEAEAVENRDASRQK